MRLTKKSQWIISDQESILNWIEGFLLDRKVRGLAEGSMKFYRVKLDQFWTYCSGRQIINMEEVDAVLIRGYLVHLEETAHNQGGCHAAYRALRAFLRWFEAERDDPHWRNPINRIGAPKVNLDPLDPVDLDGVMAILDTCRTSFADMRDRSMILMLMDTGVRAEELLNLNMQDINPVSGILMIRQGKGRKARTREWLQTQDGQNPSGRSDF